MSRSTGSSRAVTSPHAQRTHGSYPLHPLDKGAEIASFIANPRSPEAQEHLPKRPPVMKAGGAR